jgi:hypothetical protein
MPRQLLLIRPSKQQADKTLPFKKAGIAKLPVKTIAKQISTRPKQRGQSGYQFVRNLKYEGTQHCGHQGPLFVGQATGFVEEEISHDRGQPVATRVGARGIDRAVGCTSS